MSLLQCNSKRHSKPGVILMHFDGTNGSTTFTDQYGATWSASAAGPTISTAQSVFGGASLNLTGTGDVQAQNSLGWNPGTGDFTAEMRVRPTNFSTIYWLFILGGSSIPVGFRLATTGKIDVAINNSIVFTTATALTSGVWTGLALVRSGTTVKMYINGTADANSATSSFNISPGQTNPGAYIGGNAGGNVLVGFIDEFRWSKVAQYTSNYTLASSAFSS